MEVFKGLSSHRPLLGDEIRLLILSSGAFDDPIRGKLKHVSLSACPSYEALSYVWGDAAKTSPMIVNGAEYPITTNLESAIRYLRRHDCSRILWIDALCINQQDIPERNAQVIRMKDIYEQATQVIIWIGEWSPYTRDQMDSAFRLAGRVFEQILSGKYDQDAKTEVRREFYKEVCLLDDLMRRPWFTRTWVIQEVAVRKSGDDSFIGLHHPLVVCGWASIPFSMLAVAVIEFQTLAIVRPAKSPSDGNFLGIASIFEFRNLRQDIVTGKTRLAPAEQLVLFLSLGSMGFKATDDRDKIYAFLGLLPPGSLPTELRPDYEASADRILWEYATYILKETRCVEILACSTSSRPGLPSWVPDWQCGVPIDDLHLSQAVHLRFLEDDKKIEVDCIILGRIAKVLDPVHIPIEIPPYLEPKFESEQSANLESTSEESIRTLARAVARVSAILQAVEAKWFGCRALDANLEILQLQKWITALGLGSGAGGQTRSGNTFTGEQVYRTLMNAKLYDGGLDMIGVVAGSCAVVKENLQYAIYEDEHGNLGTTLHQCTRPSPGDVTCHIKGSTFEYILRPENGEWSLVGLSQGRLPMFTSTKMLEKGRGFVDLQRMEPHKQSENAQKSEDLKNMEEYWAANRLRTRRIVIH